MRVETFSSRIWNVQLEDGTAAVVKASSRSTMWPTNCVARTTCHGVAEWEQFGYSTWTAIACCWNMRVNARWLRI